MNVNSSIFLAKKEMDEQAKAKELLARMKEREAELIKAGKLKRIPCKYNVIIHGLEDSRFEKADEYLYKNCNIISSKEK